MAEKGKIKAVTACSELNKNLEVISVSVTAPLTVVSVPSVFKLTIPGSLGL